VGPLQEDVVEWSLIDSWGVLDCTLCQFPTMQDSSVVQDMGRYGDQGRMSHKMLYMYWSYSVNDQSLFRKEGEKLYITFYHLDSETKPTSWLRCRDSKANLGASV
jgi:hypothetical protein